MPTKAEALMKFLSSVANHHGVGRDIFVVGGAVRNHLMALPPKDIDVVVDSLALKGKDSEWFAKEVQKEIPVRSNLTTNNYGVAILSVAESWGLEGHEMKGETIEIANARKESYGGEGGKGYKPHLVEPATIEDDLARRDFTCNTLLWALGDLTHGPEHAEVLDLLGTGKEHLEKGELHTPADPDKTFGDDPTRMLRCLKFMSKYGFKLPGYMAEAIRRNAPKLSQMPWDAVRKILTDDILDAPNPRKSIVLMKELGLADVLRGMLHAEPGMASALGRSLNDHEAHVLLDLLDLGWVVRTPISFLDKTQQLRLREILLEFAGGDPGFDKRFVQELTKPQVDQQRLFTQYAIPPKERGSVVQIARACLLRDPLLNEHPKALEGEVEAEVARRYPLADASTPESIAFRFVNGR